jgi:membrane-associated phospholipid phosphatase
MDFFHFAYEHVCEPFYQPSLLLNLFFSCSFISIFIPLILFCVSFAHKELLTLLFSAFSILNYFLNLVLREWIFQQPVPKGGCTTLDFGMPSLQLQQASFLVTFYCLYMSLWDHGKRHWLTKFVVIGGPFLYLMFTAAGQCFLGGNTPFQIGVGTMVGVLFALLSLVIIYRWIWPKFPRILSWRVMHKMGYRDDLCGTAPRHVNPPS